MIHRAKLLARLGPADCVKKPWFLPWSLYHFVGSAGGYKRPTYPKHILMSENPGVFDEWARLTMWRQRKRAGVPHPAQSLWKGGRLPQWAALVSKEMDRMGKPQAPLPQPEPPAHPPAPNATLTARAQRVVFTAWRPLDGLRGFRLAISADENVAGDPANHWAYARTARDSQHADGQEAAVWGNQSQIGIDQMYRFGEKIGADYLIWQAETIGEMEDVWINPDGSVAANSPISRGELVLIGNANAWTQPQRATFQNVFVASGKAAFIQETYTNCGDPWPDAYGTQGVQAASISPGVGWDRFPYQLPEYKQHTPAAQWPAISPYLAEDMDSTSWAVLP